MKAWGEFGKGWQMEKFYIAQSKPYYQPLIAVPRAWTGNTNGNIAAPVILVKASSMNELLKYKEKLKGKVVIQPLDEELEVTFEPLAKRFTEDELIKMVGLQDIKPDPDPFTPRKSRNNGGEVLPFSVLKDFF